MNKVFLGIIAGSLTILAIPNVIDGYKVTAGWVAEITAPTAEGFCTSAVVENQQRLFNEEHEAGIVRRGQGTVYIPFRRFASTDNCIKAFGTYSQYPGA